MARLLAAGAVCLGVTNVSEACMFCEADNRVYGRTSNPYDTGRTSGGSSGGNAALVSACAAPFAIGSDVGGSTRIPAMYCGLFGHKPTGGAVPNTRTWPPTAGLQRRYCQLGPSARHAEDLMPLLRLVAGPDGVDSSCRPLALGDAAAVRLRGLRLLNCAAFLGGGLAYSRRSAEHVAAHGALVGWLRAQPGCEVGELPAYPELAEAFDIWAAMLGAATEEAFHSIISRAPADGAAPVARLLSLPAELLRLLGANALGCGRSNHTLPALGLALVEKVDDLMPARQRRLIAAGGRLKAALAAALGEDGVLLFPSLPKGAPFHGGHIRRLSFLDCGVTGLFNVLELPATQIPLGGLSHGP